MVNMPKSEAIAPKLTDIFKALSNPHRLEIFIRLACCAEEYVDPNPDGQICECVGKLGESLGIAPSTVSHHLKELVRAGLIKMNRRGQSVECRIDPETVKLLAAFFENPSCR